MRNLIVVATLVLAIVLTITLGYGAGLTHAPSSPHNPGPDGTGWIHDDLALTHPPEVQHARLDRHGTLDPATRSLLILAPQTAYADDEVDALAAFLDAGGRVLIADEAGAGRHLVDRLELGVSISRAPVFSTSYIDDPMRPLVASTGRLDGSPEQLELTRTHAVIGNGDALLRTHELSWIDLDHDGRPSLGEPQGSFAVARIVPTGQGALMVVAAPTLFHQEIHTDDPEAAAQTRQAMLAWLTENDRRLVVHEAHRGSPDPFGLTALLSESAPLVSASGALVAAALIVLTAFGLQVRRVRPARQKPGPHEHHDPALRAALFELPER